MANRPVPEIEITPQLVRELLSDQFPELATQPLAELSHGWDNTSLRLGDDAIVRVPHRQAAADLILHEQRWLPLLAQQIDLPIPAPTHIGTPTDIYPWAWSITRFFEGHEAAGCTLVDPALTAATLGHFFRQLHTSAPADAPTNQFRGCALGDREASFRSCLNSVHDAEARRSLAAMFDAACAVPTSGERVWLHGDLHTRNIVVHNGELGAIIDWGDVCAGDRATDLAGAYMLVPDHLEVVQAHAGADEAAWRRARGWAANFAAVYLANSDDEPVMRAVGTRLVETLRAE